MDNTSKISSSVAQFKPRQIVCLEHENTRLYGEVIQIISGRKLCWVRPLMLAIDSPNVDRLSISTNAEQSFNLAESSDLLWPISLFRAALDTEVIPLLIELNSFECSINNDNSQYIRQKLNIFVKQVWQAHQNLF
ncbi:MAG: hypothetical protein ACRC2R_02800 [Xenococcaceae cyanobacterium]